MLTLKACNHKRLMVSVHKSSVGVASDYYADMSGAYKAVYILLVFAYPFKSGNYRLESRHKLNIFYVSPVRLFKHQRICRCCGFKAHSRNHIGCFRVLPGFFDSFKRRIHNLHIDAVAFAFCKASVSARNLNHISERQHNAVIFFCIFKAFVYICGRCHTHRTARS